MAKKKTFRQKSETLTTGISKMSNSKIIEFISRNFDG